jgi:hypothetical protein
MISRSLSTTKFFSSDFFVYVFHVLKLLFWRARAHVLATHLLMSPGSDIWVMSGFEPRELVVTSKRASSLATHPSIEQPIPLFYFFNPIMKWTPTCLTFDVPTWESLRLLKGIPSSLRYFQLYKVSVNPQHTCSWSHTSILRCRLRL